MGTLCSSFIPNTDEACWLRLPDPLNRPRRAVEVPLQSIFFLIVVQLATPLGSKFREPHPACSNSAFFGKMKVVQSAPGVARDRSEGTESTQHFIVLRASSPVAVYAPLTDTAEDDVLHTVRDHGATLFSQRSRCLKLGLTPFSRRVQQAERAST